MCTNTRLDQSTIGLVIVHVGLQEVSAFNYRTTHAHTLTLLHTHTHTITYTHTHTIIFFLHICSGLSQPIRSSKHPNINLQLRLDVGYFKY